MRKERIIATIIIPVLTLVVTFLTFLVKESYEILEKAHSQTIKPILPLLNHLPMTARPNRQKIRQDLIQIWNQLYSPKAALQNRKGVLLKTNPLLSQTC